MTRPFIGNRRGAVLVLFSLILPVILIGILGLASLSGLTSARADLQAASDAAANAVLADLNSALQLSATPDALVTDFDKQARASAVVQALLGSRSDITNISTVVNTGPSTISVTVSAQIRNVTGDLFSLPFFTNSATTTVSWMRAEQLQIVLAVDSGTTAGNTFGINALMTMVRPLIVLAVDYLATVPNYPNIAMAFVPFTAQISTDPTTIVADATSDSGDFFAYLQTKFADASADVSSLFVSKANAAVNLCYSDPILPAGVNAATIGAVSAPIAKPCASQIMPIRGLRKISMPYVKGIFTKNEPLNSPAKIARDDLKSAISAISPAGCRNLAMGITWSLSQLPVDTNPKIIFMLSNGKNSQSPKGKTSDCGSSVSAPAITQEQLDSDFVAACKIVRDPAQNKGRTLDLLVLQALDGNAPVLKSCASTTDGTVNYFSTSSLNGLASLIEQARARTLTIAQAQIKARNGKKKNSNSGNDND